MNSFLEKIKFFAMIGLIYYPFIFFAGLLSINKITETQKKWSQYACSFLKVNFRKLPGSNDVNRNQRTLILFNHRTWSDFCVHDYILDFTANFLSRYMVALAMPFALFLSPFMKSLWFFNRGSGGKRDFDKFYEWIDYKWNKSARNNLIVYPEGHRMYNASKPGELKKGMIKYAFDKKIPVQIGISMGNEQLVNEKKLIITRGKTITYYIDSVINTSDFQEFDKFFKHIEKRFTEIFDKVYKEHYTEQQDSKKDK